MTLTLFENWMNEAACTGTDSEAFFIHISRRTTRTDMIRFETAQSICEQCPVKQNCLDFAIENECVGLFGGVYFK